MNLIHRVGALTLLVAVPGVLFFVEPSAAQAPPPSAPFALPSETPAKFEPVTASFDYTRRDVMIPMRDGLRE